MIYVQDRNCYFEDRKPVSIIMFSFVQSKENGLLLHLHVQPGANNSEFVGVHGNSLKLRISARAVDGAANQAVCAFLAKEFGLSKSSVSILKGQTARQKTIFMEGDPQKLLHQLKTVLATDT